MFRQTELSIVGNGEYLQRTEVRTMRGYFWQNNRQLIAENGLNSEGLTGRYDGAVGLLHARSPYNCDTLMETNTFPAVQNDITNAVLGK